MTNIWSGADLKERMIELTRGRWSRSRSKFQDYADTHYYLPTRAELDYLLRFIDLPAEQAVKEVFDCDDFAFLMKGKVSQAYRTRLYDPVTSHRAALCFGVAWGRFSSHPANDSDHALNWSLVWDAGATDLVFVEPQTKAIHGKSALKKDLWLLLV